MDGLPDFPAPENAALIIPELNGAKIRKTPDGRFSIYDVIRVAGGKKNPAEVWRSSLCNRYPKLLNDYEMFKFPGRGQKYTPVASAKQCAVILDILLRGSVVSSENLQILSMLESDFWMFNPKSEFCVKSKKGVYRVDLFLESANVAIECDEHGHRSYDQKKEKKRQSEIQDVLGCTFVRFDPYAKNYDDILLLERVANAAGITDLQRYLLMQEIAWVDHCRGAEFEENRYLGLYGKNARQLRKECGADGKETPLNYMGGRDLNLNSLSNQAALESGDVGRVGLAAQLFRDAFERASGKPLTPDWQQSCLPPSKARKVISDGQMELPT